MHSAVCKTGNDKDKGDATEPRNEEDRCYCYTRHKNTQDAAYVSDSAAVMFSEFFRGLKAKKWSRIHAQCMHGPPNIVGVRMLLHSKATTIGIWR